MSTFRRLLVLISAAGLLAPLLLLLTPTAASAAVFQGLTLQNGWANYGDGTASAGVSLRSGIVTLKGAIATAGTNPAAFTLPAADRPATTVYVPVDLCDATNGRLEISPSGVATVEAEGGTFSNAQCFTSLEGVSFAKSSTSFTALSLQNGWTNGPFGTSNAAARKIVGIVHLEGAVASGTTGVITTLPAGLRPATTVYVQVDLCGAANGRLEISPSGVVSVQAENNFSDAQCFTSLDGVSFAASASGFTTLSLQNGWTNAPFSTSNAAAEDIAGIVHLKGAVASGTTDVITTLPAALRPANTVYIPVDLCNATNGRLIIAPTGTVSVEAESSFSDAQCFTSLDGASFTP